LQQEEIGSVGSEYEYTGKEYYGLSDNKSFSISLHDEAYSCRFVGPDLIRVENSGNSHLAYFLKRNQAYPGSST